MPGRAAPFRRRAVEEALGPEHVAHLRKVFAEIGGPGTGWDGVPAAVQLYGTLAAVRLARRIRSDEGASAKEAEERAALRLGMSPHTARNRLDRIIRAAYRANTQSRGRTSENGGRHSGERAGKRDP